MKRTAPQLRDDAHLLRTFASFDDVASSYAAEYGDHDRANELLDRRNRLYDIAEYLAAAAEAAALAALETAPPREIPGLTDGPTHFYDDGLHGITPGAHAIVS